MKTIRSIPLILAILVTLALAMPYSTTQGQAQTAGTPAPPKARLFLPISNRTKYEASITGQVKDLTGKPLAGVTVIDQHGRAAISDGGGSYLLSGLPTGDYALAATHTKYRLAPMPRQVKVKGRTSGQDFQAVAECSNVIVNGASRPPTVGSWAAPVSRPAIPTSSTSAVFARRAPV